MLFHEPSEIAIRCSAVALTVYPKAVVSLKTSLLPLGYHPVIMPNSHFLDDLTSLSDTIPFSVPTLASPVIHGYSWWNFDRFPLHSLAIVCLRHCRNSSPTPCSSTSFSSTSVRFHPTAGSILYSLWAKHGMNNAQYSLFGSESLFISILHFGTPLSRYTTYRYRHDLYMS